MPVEVQRTILKIILLNFFIKITLRLQKKLALRKIEYVNRGEMKN